MKKEISFGEFLSMSPWTARIKEGKKLYEKSEKSLMKEYNEDKYAPLMGCKTFAEAIRAYRGPTEDIPYSRHGGIFMDDKDAVYELRKQLMLESLRPILEHVDCVIELGAGFGQSMQSIQEAYPGLAYRAGEYTPNACELGQRLLPGVQFFPFNFYTPEDWENIFAGVKNALVYTVHAVEMIPDAELFVREIRKHKDKIHSVVNFEPVYQNDGTEMTEWRIKYINANSYCKNILQSVPNPATVEKDFFGVNPLFPKARIVWNP